MLIKKLALIAVLSVSFGTFAHAQVPIAGGGSLHVLDCAGPYASDGPIRTGLGYRLTCQINHTVAPIYSVSGCVLEKMQVYSPPRSAVVPILKTGQDNFTVGFRGDGLIITLVKKTLIASIVFAPSNGGGQAICSEK